MNNKRYRTLLTKLNLTNFRSFNELTIKFGKKNVIIIIGNNGLGKSSILDAIAYCLSYFTFRLFTLDAKKKDIDSELKQEDINIEQSKSTCILDFEWIDQKIQVDTRIEINSDNVNSNINPSEYVDNFRSIVSSDNDFPVPVIAYYRSHRSKVEEDHSPHPGTYDQRIYAIHRAFRESFSNFTGFESWYSAVHLESNKVNEPNKLEQINKALILFLNEFHDNEFTDIRLVESRIRSRYKYYNFRIEVMKSGKWILLRNLSSGEKSLIFLVCDIARRLSVGNNHSVNSLKGHGIVLIDEIELHLHPSWQRKILSSLIHIFPNIQFIVSTHSPFVVNSVDKALVYELDSNDRNSNVRVKKTISSTSNSISYVLQSLFEIEEQFGKPTQELLDKFYKYRNQIMQDNKINSKLLIKLSKELRATNDIEIIDIIDFEMNQLYKSTKNKKYKI